MQAFPYLFIFLWKQVTLPGRMNPLKPSRQQRFDIADNYINTAKRLCFSQLFHLCLHLPEDLTGNIPYIIQWDFLLILHDNDSPAVIYPAHGTRYRRIGSSIFLLVRYKINYVDFRPGTVFYAEQRQLCILLILFFVGKFPPLFCQSGRFFYCFVIPGKRRKR